MKLTDFVPINANRVLLICSCTDPLFAEIKRLSPNIDISVIVIPPEGSRCCEIDLHTIHTNDAPSLSAVNDRQERAGCFDCIVYDNVIGRFEDPWAIISGHLGSLTLRGTILVTTRNVEYWRNIDRLLRGTLLNDAGSFSGECEARVYSSELIRRALVGMGLNVVDVYGLSRESEVSDSFFDIVVPCVASLGIDPREFMRRSAPKFNIWRAQRAATNRLRIVSTMLNPVGGVSHVRVIEPMRALATSPNVEVEILGNADLPDDYTAKPGVFIFHRPLLAGEVGLRRVRELISAGWLVVCEFDDHPDYIPVLQRPDVYNFRAVHAVQTSTDRLASVLRQYNPEVTVFPNAVLELPEVANYAHGMPLKILFAGMNREGEWPNLISAINRVIKRAGELVRFDIIGDRNFFEALQTPFKQFAPLCDYATYQGKLAQSEISFMPLSDTPFNRCKSDLKFIEAAAHRVVSLASSIVYEDSIDNGCTGLLFSSAIELQEHLLYLVSHPERGREIGDQARSYVIAKRMSHYQIERRVSWYTSLWSKREELQQALMERVPALVNRSMILS